MPSKSRERVEHAPAKVNLTLRVIGRRADGYHTLESLVVFAGVQDRVAFVPGGELSRSLCAARTLLRRAPLRTIWCCARRARLLPKSTGSSSAASR